MIVNIGTYMSKQKPLSFSLCPDNIAYINEQYQLKHRNRSHWLDDLVTHLREKSPSPDKAESKAKALRVPSNFDDQFEILWSAKGRKGAKKTAREKMRGFCKGETAEDVEAFIAMLVRDINEQLKSEVLGFADLHLTTYLNQERWEK